MKNNFDLNQSPWITIWETTQACDVSSLDYGDWVQPEVDPLELTTQEGEHLLREVAELKPHIFMFSGADPLKREDIFHLVRYAAAQQLHPIMAVRATPLLTRDAVAHLKEARLSRIVFALNGSTAELHDLISGVRGSFDRTLEATQWAVEFNVPFQITTHLCERNLRDLENMAAMLKLFRISQWNVHFPVLSQSSQAEEMLSAREFEDAFSKLYEMAQKVPFKIKTSEAPHYRRYVLQKQAEARAIGPTRPPQFEEGIPGILPVNEDRNTVFISHTGEVYPCASLPVVGGNVRIQSLLEIYRNSQALQALRDVANLKGKCGICGFKQVCGGSRARAFAVSADSFAEEPSCIYRPLQPNLARTGSPDVLPPVKMAAEPQD